MPRPPHGPPCGLFINNACECIYIHKQGQRGRKGAWQPRRGQRFTHGKQNGFTFWTIAKPKWLTTSTSRRRRRETKEQTATKQNKTLHTEKKRSGEKGNWQRSAKHFDGAAKYATKFLTLDETVPVFGDWRTEGTADYSWHLWCDNCGIEELFWSSSNKFNNCL